MNMKSLTIAVVIVLTSPVLVAGAIPLRVESSGQDGDQRIYSVQCPTDIRLAMSHSVDRNTICFVPHFGHEQCLPGDDLEKVARQACAISVQNIEKQGR